MLPLLLSFCLFLFLIAVGKALLTILRVRLPVLLSWLLAPCMGVALVITLVVNINQLGIPVHRFARPLGLTLLVGALAVFVLQRPKVPWRYLGYFLLTALFSLLYTGWPAILNGFNWFSYGNDDMANYAVAADRFLNQGFYTLPTLPALSGLDYSQNFWFMHVKNLMRPGTEEFLAWVAGLTGLHPMYIFMSTALALSLCQIFATGALVLTVSIKYRRMALFAAVLLALSPLFTLGTLYQLITQQVGLALLCSSLALVTWVITKASFSWRRLVAAAFLVNGLCLFYPEVAPFFALSLILFVVLQVIGRGKIPFLLIAKLVLVGLGTFVILNKNIGMFLVTMLSQAQGASAAAGVPHSERFVLFPWSLVPSSWAMLWGFVPFGKLWSEPYNSAAIALGIFYFLLTFLWALWGIRKGEAWRCLLLVMSVMGAWLFHIEQDFGLFKLHMYIQPALMIGFASVLSAISVRTLFRVGAVLLYFAATYWSQTKYSEASAGLISSGLNEIHGVSKIGMSFPILPEFKGHLFLLENSNPTLAKLTTSLLKGYPIKMIGRDVYSSVSDGTSVSQALDLETWKQNNYSVEDQELKKEFINERIKMMRESSDSIDKLKARLSFTLPRAVFAKPPEPKDTEERMFGTEFIDISETFNPYLNQCYLISGPPEYEQFNKFNPPPNEPTTSFVEFTPLPKIQNYLVFIHTPKGSHYYSGGRLNASFFQREPDTFDDHFYFHGMGKFTLFRVLNPTPKIRLRLMLSRTLMGSGRNLLPHEATVTGDSVHSIPWIGSGAACVFTEPITPLSQDGEYYVALDMGIKGQKFPIRKRGLMKMYNEDFSLDDRRLVAFCRDISAVSEEQYQSLVRPFSVKHFPLDIINQPNLEYSGIYEDGWISPDAYFIFGKSDLQTVVRIRGTIPGVRELSDGAVLTVSINDKVLSTVPLIAGSFSFSLPLQQVTTETKVQLHFDKAIVLAGKDGRTTSAQMQEISLEPEAGAIQAPQTVSLPKDFKSDANWDYSGSYLDGWVGPDSSYQLGASTEKSVLEIRGRIPRIKGLEKGTTLDVIVNQRLLQEIELGTGEFSAQVPVLQASSINKVELAFKKSITLPSPDGRTASAIISQLSIH